MKGIIIGGGIGGLTAALALKKSGIDVKVFESVEQIRPLGVGINLLPHSIRVLTNLGLLDAIAALAVETKELNYFDKFGKQFWSEPRGKFAGYKWPQFSIHRGAFQMLLLEEAKKSLGAENIKTSHHLHSFSQDETGVRASFVNAQQQICHVAEGDFLIGADGINSVVRAQLYPNEGKPKFSSNVLYRGTAMLKPYLSGASMVMVGSLKQKMVAYPISPEIQADGTQLINWVANLKEIDASTTRDWNKIADKNRLLDLYQNWQFEWLNVHEMIEKTDLVYEYPMSDRDPLPKWTFGRVTLLGDAAHPMYPIGSNGASQAILDADALALAIVDAPNIEEALIQYDLERVPTTAKIVEQNRQKGPDEIMDLMEDRFPNGFKEHEIPMDDLTKVMDNYRIVAGFDKASLNQKS